MKPNRIQLLVGVTAAVVGLAIHATAFAQSRRGEILIDYAPPPSDWTGLIAQADAVAIIRLVSVEHKYSPENPISRRVWTLYETEVLEVIKDDKRHPLDQTVQIHRRGGVTRGPEGDSVTAERGFPAWSKGMVLLVALTWNEFLKAHTPFLGPDGAFELVADSGPATGIPAKGRVRSYGRGVLAGSQHGKNVQMVLTEVRMKARDVTSKK